MDTPAFNFFSPQRLVFGPGKMNLLPELTGAFGKNILLVTGKSSFLTTPAWDGLEKAYRQNRVRVHQAAIPGEPSPEDVDTAVDRYRDSGIDAVVAVGGGSALDAGKAISAMLAQSGPVTAFLEGVGDRRPGGEKLPFIAVPTTSGTGSEATKNAVISRPGAKGFKKSLRHDNFIPDIALVDPELTLTCPPGITAACGMDALTQLLEAYVSTQASPVTDALCTSAIKGFSRALFTAAEEDPKDINARTRLSYGAYISGLALANAGLGAVHGFASVIGGISPMSHGNVCGTLLAQTTKAIIDELNRTAPGHPALEEYANAAVLLGLSDNTRPVSTACNRLLDNLFEWTEKLNMPGLGQSGIRQDQLASVAAATGLKNTPVKLGKKALAEILRNRL
ncbi:MAG: iron-containing alcohol dehydrogenase [Desulfobacterales bacterium]|nr:iron-containing alcohol dehydrogenase [Desulfobacterales bacterium]